MLQTTDSEVKHYIVTNLAHQLTIETALHTIERSYNNNNYHKA